MKTLTQGPYGVRYKGSCLYEEKALVNLAL